MTPHLSNKLNVKRSVHFQRAADGTANEPDLSQRLLVEVLRWGDERCVPAVDPCVLDVLRHGHTHHLSVTCHGVHVDLLVQRRMEHVVGL